MPRLDLTPPTLRYLGPKHIATGEGAYALGILKHVTGFTEDARKHYKQARAIYEDQLGTADSTSYLLSAACDS
jgi:hypothetical protein